MPPIATRELQRRDSTRWAKLRHERYFRSGLKRRVVARTQAICQSADLVSVWQASGRDQPQQRIVPYVTCSITQNRVGTPRARRWR